MKSMTILGMIGPWQVVLIVLVVLILFVKIPELMKGLGKGMKEFKDTPRKLIKTKKRAELKNKKSFYKLEMTFRTKNYR